MSLLTDLVAYWPLDETSGTRVDATGRGNDLSPVTTVATTTGMQGNAAVFEGQPGGGGPSTGYLSRAATSDLNLGDIDVTIACWIRLDADAWWNPYNHIMGKSSGSPDFITEWRLMLSSDPGEPRVEISLVAEPFVHGITWTVPVDVGVNIWTFLIFWYDTAADTLNAQINHGTIYSTAYTGGAFIDNRPLSIGTHLHDPAWPLWGAVDEVGIWKRVLSSDERTALYNGGAGVTYPFSGVGGPSTTTLTPSAVELTWAAASPVARVDRQILTPTSLALIATPGSPILARPRVLTATPASLTASLSPTTLRVTRALTPTVVLGSWATTTPSQQGRQSLLPDAVAGTLVLSAPVVRARIRLAPTPVSATTSLTIPRLTHRRSLAPTAPSLSLTLTSALVQARRLLTALPLTATASLGPAVLAGRRVLLGAPQAATWSPGLPQVRTQVRRLTPAPLSAQLSAGIPTPQAAGVRRPTPVLLTAQVTTPALQGRRTLTPTAVTGTTSVTTPALRRLLGLTPTPVLLTAAAQAPTRGVGPRVVTPTALTLTAQLTDAGLHTVQIGTPSPVMLTGSLGLPQCVGRATLQPVPMTAGWTAGVGAPALGARELGPIPVLAAWLSPLLVIALGGVVVEPEPVTAPAMLTVPHVERLGAGGLAPEPLLGTWGIEDPAVPCLRLAPEPVQLTWAVGTPFLPGAAPAALRGLRVEVGGVRVVDLGVTTHPSVTL